MAPFEKEKLRSALSNFHAKSNLIGDTHNAMLQTVMTHLSNIYFFNSARAVKLIVLIY